MESRTKELVGEAKSMAGEAAENWSNRTKAAYQAAQDKAISGAKATDRAIRANPYSSLGIAFGAGLLLGVLIKRK